MRYGWGILKELGVPKGILSVSTEGRGPVLAELEREYNQLSSSLNEVDLIRTSLKCIPSWDAALENILEQRKSDIRDRLHAIAVEAAAVAARHVDDFVSKAKITLDWCEPNPQGLPDLLTVSLCRDIVSSLRHWTQASPEDNTPADL